MLLIPDVRVNGNVSKVRMDLIERTNITLQAIKFNRKRIYVVQKLLRSNQIRNIYTVKGSVNL
jgi:hypothetical protein